MDMFLYLVTAVKDDGYDTTLAQVISASSKYEAKIIWDFESTRYNSKLCNIKLIGKSFMVRGVVIESFLSG